jgi:maltooligosyltrehalose trehalohydrolase
MTAETLFQFGPERRDGAVAFRLWAPGADQVMLEIDGSTPVAMTRSADGWHRAERTTQTPALYRFRLPDGTAVPDPASRFQPYGVHGPSLAPDPTTYRWQNTAWHGRPWHETVIYELHVGLLGGYDGVSRKLSELAALGVTAIELMPLAEFSGTRNWGYDGVLPFSRAAATARPML